MSRRSWPLWLSAALLTFGLSLSPAWAQHPTGGSTASISVDPNDAIALDPFDVTLSLILGSDGQTPSDPKLQLPSGWTSSAPTVQTQSQISIMNGQTSAHVSANITWRVMAPRAGQALLGPVMFLMQGRSYRVDPVAVTVRPAGTPHRRKSNFFDPFGMLGGMPSLDDSDLFSSGPEISSDQKLQLDAPLESQAFLRAFVDKSQAVTGEQVTLSIYLYTIPSAAQVLDPHEPDAVDFFQRTLQLPRTGGAQRLNIGGSPWNVQLIRKMALFPLRAGELTVGPMTITLVGRAFTGSGSQGGLVRSSRPLKVHVSDPPVLHRPPGYAIGDVGSFSLSATVEPRSLSAGASFAVIATLKGTGNLPLRLKVPEQAGITWLEPDTHDSVAEDDGVISGTRTFTYVVQADRPGTLALGSLKLPFWDPRANQYQVASVDLGSVVVTGAAKPSSSQASPVTEDNWATLPLARTTAHPDASVMAPFTDSRWFWVALPSAPLLVLAGEGLQRALGRLRQRFQGRKSSPERQAREALKEAREAASKQEGERAASLIERAMVLAVQASTEIALRGLLREEIAGALVRRGISQELADELVALLQTCDDWRFNPTVSPSGAPPIERADALLRALFSRRKR